MNDLEAFREVGSIGRQAASYPPVLGNAVASLRKEGEMMTRLTTKWMIAVATLVAAAGSASAQNLLKADIPFTFRAGNALMQPGTYQVTPPSGNSRYVVLRNQDTHSSIILAGYTAGDPEKGWKDSGVSRLMFECLGHQCVLRELWSASSAYAQVFPGPKLGRDDAPQITEIRLTRSKAD